jgi:hypothetical protein
MTEEEFRQKYPHSTDEQVRLYCEAVAAEMAGFKPPVEPDIPMPMITVPVRVVPEAVVTSYAGNFYMRNFSLADVPPEAEPTDCAAELREILLGHHGFSVSLSPEARQRLATTEDMTEADVLALLVGAPSAREFVNLA